MKISTILLGSALLISGSAFAQENLMAKANEGATGDKGAMAENGWQCWKFPFSFDEMEDEYTFGEPEQMTWDAGGPAGNNVRWENKSSVVTYNGASYDKNVAFIRWDNGSMHSFWFVYPVEITTPGIYEFSMLAGGWSNLSGDSDNSYIKGTGDTCNTMVLFSDVLGPEGVTWDTEEEGSTDISVLGLPAEGEGKLFSLKKEEGNDHADLKKCSVEVDAKKAGTYYVEILGSHAIIVMSDFRLTLLKESAVNSIESDATVVSEEFYGIDGTRMDRPSKGSLVISRQNMSDGTVKTVKRIIRQ